MTERRVWTWKISLWRRQSSLVIIVYSSISRTWLSLQFSNFPLVQSMSTVLQLFISKSRIANYKSATKEKTVTGNPEVTQSIWASFLPFRDIQTQNAMLPILAKLWYPARKRPALPKRQKSCNLKIRSLKAPSVHRTSGIKDTKDRVCLWSLVACFAVRFMWGVLAWWLVSCGPVWAVVEVLTSRKKLLGFREEVRLRRGGFQVWLLERVGGGCGVWGWGIWSAMGGVCCGGLSWFDELASHVSVCEGTGHGGSELHISHCVCVGWEWGSDVCVGGCVVVWKWRGYSWSGFLSVVVVDQDVWLLMMMMLMVKKIET